MRAGRSLASAAAGGLLYTLTERAPTLPYNGSELRSYNYKQYLCYKHG